MLIRTPWNRLNLNIDIQLHALVAHTQRPLNRRLGVFESEYGRFAGDTITPLPALQRIGRLVDWL
jgi:hypothetical protein